MNVKEWIGRPSKLNFALFFFKGEVYTIVPESRLSKQTVYTIIL